MSEANGTTKIDALPGVLELDDFDFSKLPEKPRPLNIDRQRSFDERSLAEVPMAFSPHVPPSRSDNFHHHSHYDSMFSPRKSALNTPRSQGDRHENPNPMIAEAWDCLRRSLVYFRGQPVGTIAALDNSDEKLNYDQVKLQLFALCSC